MNYNFKILKKTVLIFTFAIFFGFTSVPHAQADNATFAACITAGTAAGLINTLKLTSSDAQIAAASAAAAVAEATAAAVHSVPVTDIPTARVAGQNLGNNTTVDPTKSVLNNIAYVLAQCTLTEMTNSTIKWIQGGFHGSPSFAISPKKVFADIANSVATELAQQIKSIGACNFVPNFTVTLSNAVDLSSDNSQMFASQVKCPFGTGDAGAFFNDFTNGGWDSFANALNDAGNPFGVAVLTGDELNQREQQQAALQAQQLAWSHGFIDLVDNDPKKCSYVNIKDKPKDPNAISLDSTGRPDPKVYTPEVISALEKKYCPITTPGNVISDQLTKTLGVDMDRLGFADDMNKVITALLTQLVQQTVRGVFK